MQSITNKIISGSVWTTLSTITTAGVQILRLAILTRFLDPSVFGLVAILTLILGLTNTFADMGFSTAIMHKQEITRDQFSSLYWIQFSLYISIYALICCFVYPISLFYNQDSLVDLIPIVLLDLIFYGIGRLYDTILLKQFQYKTLAIRNIVCCLISLLIALFCALKGLGIYSLILSTLSQSLFLNIWNFIAGQKYIKITFCYDIKNNLDLIRIGLYQTGSQILDYLSSKLDILILGKVLGTSDLGVYSLAKELVIKVYTISNNIINKILLPIFSSIQDNLEKVQNYYCRLLETSGLINFFGYMIMGALAPQFVCYLYGRSYSSVVPILMILCIWGMFASIGNPISNIIIAYGKTDKSFLYTIIRIVIYAPVIWYFSSMSLTAMSLGQILLSIIFLIVSYTIILRPVIHISLKKWLKSFVPMIAYTSLLIIVGYHIANILFIKDEPSIYTIILIFCLCLTYMFGAEMFYKDLITSTIKPLLKKTH